MVPVVTSEQRRIRLGVRHHLAAAAPDPVSVAGALIGLHSSDPATVYLAARARVAGDVVAALDAALYAEKSLVRVLGMRRTMFVVPTPDAPLLQFGCVQRYAAAERDRLAGMLEAQGIATDGGAWLDKTATETLAALDALGEATATELRDHVPGLREQLVFGEGKSWGGKVGLSTRILFLLATDGAVMRARPRGSWTSAAYRWAPTGSWLGRKVPEVGPDRARAELARRWLIAFGPGTFEDLKWWSGWTVSDTRRALAALGTMEVDLDGGTGIALAGDDFAVGDSDPWVALLPSLDPTTMGWKHRHWYLGDDAGPLFDRNGNAGPTVWYSGRVIGGWAQRADGEIVFRLLEDLGAVVHNTVEFEADRLRRWLGDVRVTPRFPTPLQRHLLR